VEDRIRVAHGSLGAAWPFAEPAAEVADLLVANIHARVLLELAPLLLEATRRGGALILSGIIAEREEDVRAAFADLGLTVTRTLADRDWRTIALRRPAGSGP